MTIDQFGHAGLATPCRLAVAGKTFFECGSSGAYSLVVPPQPWIGIFYLGLSIVMGGVAIGFGGITISIITDEGASEQLGAVALLACLFGGMSLLSWFATYFGFVAWFQHSRERRLVIDINRGEARLTNVPWLKFTVQLELIGGIEIQTSSEDGHGPAWLALRLREQTRMLFLCAGGRGAIVASSGRDELMPLGVALSEVLGVPVRTTLGLRYWQMLLR
jgi:hypothetical protein